MDQPIHTIEARGNITLEVIRDYFGLSEASMQNEIQGAHRKTIGILKSKGISYPELRTSLVPRTDRFEAGFLFDTQEIKSSWYGLEVMKEILSLLGNKSNHSVLCGDLIGRDQDLIYQLLKESLILHRDFIFVHGTLLYCVYINNLSETKITNFHKHLSSYPPYIGYIPCTYTSRIKTFLSTILVHSFLKNDNRIIMGHADDLSNDNNVNTAGYPFEDFGLNIFSLQSLYFGLFLSYKIECPVYPGMEIDTEISLNAISTQVIPLNEFSIHIDDKKFKYLKNEKSGKLTKAEINNYSRKELSDLIKNKIASNYIYNLHCMSEHGVSKFNVLLEIPRITGGHPTRLLAALEYKPEAKILRLITLH